MIQKNVFFALLFLITLKIPAQNNCIIEGIVREKSTGIPVYGAWVYIDNIYDYKTLTNDSGEFRISNIPQGKYRIKVFLPDFKEFSKIVKLETGEKLTVKIEMVKKHSKIKVGRFIPEYEKAVPDSGNGQNITSNCNNISINELNSLPGTDIDYSISLTPGFTGGTFRGGREFGGETVFIVDGIFMANPIGMGTQTDNTGAGKGNFKWGLATELPRISIEEIQVITGGFNAEYGQAQSAVINVISREGSQSEYNGEIRLECDAPYLLGENDFYKPHLVPMYYGPNPDYYTDKDNYILPDAKAPNGQTVFLNEYNKPVLDFDIYGKPVTAKNLYVPYQRWPKTRSIEFFLSGPMPGTKKYLNDFFPGNLTFSLSGIYSHNDEGWRKRGIDYGYSTSNNIVYKPHSNLKFVFSFLKQKRDWILYDRNSDFYLWPDGVTTGDIFAFGTSGQPIFVPEYNDYNPLFEDGYYKLEVKNFELLNRLPVLNTFSSRYLLNMEHKLNPSTDYKLSISLFETGKNQYARDPLTLEALPYDDGGNLGIDAPRFKTTRSTVAGPADFIPNTHPNTIQATIEHTNQKILEFKGDMQHRFNKTYLLKSGIQLRYYDLFMEDYGIISGGNDNNDFYHLFPIYTGIYVQNKFDLNNTVLNIGLRADYMNPKCKYSKTLEKDGTGMAVNPDYSSYEYIGDERRIGNPGDAKSQINISPRIAVTRSVSENTSLYFSYGHYIQYPQFDRYFTNHTFDLRPYMKIIGNPNLKPEKTLLYEVGFGIVFKKTIHFEATAFHKNVTDLIYVEEVRDQYGQNFYMYENFDFAEMKGLEISLRKDLYKNWSFRISYTLQSAKGRYTSILSSDIYDNEYRVPRTKMYYLDWDRRHTVNAYLTFKTPDYFGDFIAGKFGSSILGNWMFTLVYRFKSGLPYSSPARNQNPPVNDRRYPSWDVWDLKVKKNFRLIKNYETYIYADIYNVFDGRDRTGIADIENYLKTGDPAQGDSSQLVEHIWQEPRSMKIGWGIRF